jgi:hypothetical protein
MSPSYQENKKHIQKWIANNREKHNAFRMKFYYKYKDPYERICKEFRHILI